MELIELVRGFVIENFLFGEGDNLSAEASLLRNGIIDSTGVLELIDYVEETFKFHVEDEEVVPENFDSLRNICNYVEAKLAESGTVVCAR